MIDFSRPLISVFVEVLVIRRGRSGKGCCRVGRNRAGAGIAPYFRPCEQRFVTRTVDCAHGNEEAVSGIEAERLRRDQLTIAFRNGDALAIEILVDGPGRYHEVVDISILGTVEGKSNALHSVAGSGEVLGCVWGPSQVGGHGGHDLGDPRGIAGRDELDQVIR